MNHPLFTKTFFKFSLAFAAILGASFVVIFVVSNWGGGA